METTQLGIVSPCSTCNNQRYLSTAGGPMNTCPRRVAQNMYLTAMTGDSGQQASASDLIQIALTGNSSVPSLSAPLNNPVYDNSSQSIIVWAATYTTNRAILDTYGNVVNPSLDQGLNVFDTTYIQCEPLPFSPNVDEHGYFLNGALKEGDPILISKNRNQYTPDGTNLKSIAGSVARSSITGTIPRNPTLSDNSPSGT